MQIDLCVFFKHFIILTLEMHSVFVNHSISGKVIYGRVIKALNKNWHPNCFQCLLCQAPLADAGFKKNAGR